MFLFQNSAASKSGCPPQPLKTGKVPGHQFPTHCRSPRGPKKKIKTGGSTEFPQPAKSLI